MTGKRSLTIAVVAPSCRLTPDAAERVTALAARLHGERVRLRFHPQCFLSHNHFAGDDPVRADAFVDAANDPEADAVWFARGGYGACRMIEAVLPRLTETARAKTYMGYSDGGMILAALHAAGFPHLAHGPMPADTNREGGEGAVTRALAWLVARDPAALEPSLAADPRPAAAFNITILSQLLGTPLQPDLSGQVLMLEEVSEHAYRIDRALFHITSNPAIRRVAGLRLGRCSQIPVNDPDFGHDPEAIARFWCERSGVPFLGEADIGHDAANRVVPFGRRQGGQLTLVPATR